MNQPRRIVVILILVLITIGLIIGAYIFFVKQPKDLSFFGGTSTSTPQFVPLGRPPTNNATSSSAAATSTGTQNPSGTPVTQSEIKPLRLISNTPVGGYAASTTATTTIIRWVDRGRGNVYETTGGTLDVVTLSNTLLPRVYVSTWGKNMTSFIGSILQRGDADPVVVYAQLARPGISPTSTPGGQDLTVMPTPFELRGKNLPTGTAAYAVSPSKDKIIFVVKDQSGSTGYTANFDGTRIAQLFKTPLTQISVEWPSESTIALTTNAGASQNGYLYFIDVKTGTWTKILGPLKGLAARVSHDAKHILISTSVDRGVSTNMYTVASSTGVDTSIKTLADKCVWGNFYKNTVYCAVPFQSVSGTYPDDWYEGKLSTVDKMWQIDAQTGQTRLVGQILGQAGRPIDAYNLGLDDKDNFLFFMNKNDLSFWSLDLVRSN